MAEIFAVLFEQFRNYWMEPFFQSIYFLRDIQPPPQWKSCLCSSEMLRSVACYLVASTLFRNVGKILPPEAP